MNDKASLVKAFTGATAAFGVTNYWETMDIDAEIQQGRNLVDAAKVVPHTTVVLGRHSNTLVGICCLSFHLELSARCQEA
jgi:uncharacterized protein YbjT (DUF2867 family)